MNQTPELRSVVEELYIAFTPYPLREDTEACSCCHSAQDEERLHRKELRKLDSRDLEQYATDALLVWGGTADFKHFLPRIFELIAMHGEDFLDPVVVFNKLYYGGWLTWPVAERHAIEQFLTVLWCCILDSPTHESYGAEIEDWLCGLAQAVGCLSPYLDSWLATKTENASLNLARFIDETDFADPRFRATAFWGERAELFNEVVAWVRSDAVRSRLKAIAGQYSECDFVERAFTRLP